MAEQTAGQTDALLKEYGQLKERFVSPRGRSWPARGKEGR